MRLLQIHNKYQNPGGEDVVVNSEHDLLLSYGHHVRQWIVTNDTISDANPVRRFAVAVNSIWSLPAQRKLSRIIEDFKPDLAHVHNTVPLLSPSIYTTCHEHNIPVVQTLHNYRLLCPGTSFYRDERICLDCLDKNIPYPAIRHACFRKSRTQSAITVASLTYNRARGTYHNDVDLYIALSDFARRKFIQSGFPPEKIVTKPNFVGLNIQEGSHDGGYALFAGRLVAQKGIATLLDAWSRIAPEITLKIAGNGPMATLMTNLPSNVHWLGHVDRDELLELMGKANLFVFPSEWHEPFGLTLIEAFASGTPVLVSNIEGQAGIVEDGESGWHFVAGDAADLARQIEQAWSNPEEMKRRGRIARKRFEENYSPRRNYDLLLAAYRLAIDDFAKGVTLRRA